MQNQSESTESTPPAVTLRNLVVARKCRRGPAVGTTKKGAFWLAAKIDTTCSPQPGSFPKILAGGGDGVGQNAPDVDGWLTLRHYRDGVVAAVVQVVSWHQNSGHQTQYVRVDEVLDCQTAEEVVVTLKGCSDQHGGHVLSAFLEDDLTAWLMAFGLPAAAPSPDE